MKDINDMKKIISIFKIAILIFILNISIIFTKMTIFTSICARTRGMFWVGTHILISRCNIGMQHVVNGVVNASNVGGSFSPEIPFFVNIL